jgi:hypothetical protein
VRPALRIVLLAETPERDPAFDDVLLEPLDEEELLRSVRTALDGSSGEG